jgi:hypothetical protein
MDCFAALAMTERPRHRRSASARIVFPAICWWLPPISATRTAGLAGYSRRSGGGCRHRAIRQNRCRDRRRYVPDRTLEATPSKAGASNRRTRTGPEACARRGDRELPAQARLAEFLQTDAAGYSTERDRPDRNGTSRLSPHLRFGEVSPRQVWHAARFAAAERPALAGDIDKYLTESGWREPDPAGREVRSRPRVCQALGVRTGATAGQPSTSRGAQAA